MFGLESRVGIADGGGRELCLHGVELRELRHDLTDVMEVRYNFFFLVEQNSGYLNGWHFSTFQLFNLLNFRLLLSFSLNFTFELSISSLSSVNL